MKITLTQHYVKIVGERGDDYFEDRTKKRTQNKILKKQLVFPFMVTPRIMQSTILGLEKNNKAINTRLSKCVKCFPKAEMTKLKNKFSII